MNQTLQLVFTNENGGRVTINVPDPVTPVDPVAVEAAMDQILDADVIITSGGGLVTKVRAVLVSRESEEVAAF